MSSQDKVFKQNFRLRANGKTLDLTTPQVMGIINVTPDSFYDGGKYKNYAKLLAHAEKMVSEGASILDLGAVSTRPGADVVTETEEMKRLLPALKMLRSSFPGTFISVDTFRAEIALAAAALGADIINDVYAGSFDNKMFDVVKQTRLPYIMMHMQGNPSNMQANPLYGNVVKELKTFFRKKLIELKKRKITQVVLDPGFGFGKTTEHNFQLLKSLNEFRKMNFPVLAGVSRKSMINRVLKTKPEGALNGTSIVNTLALLNGASILRVHDVKEAIEAVKLIEFYKSC